MIIESDAAVEREGELLSPAAAPSAARGQQTIQPIPACPATPVNQPERTVHLKKTHRNAHTPELPTLSQCKPSDPGRNGKGLNPATKQGGTRGRGRAAAAVVCAESLCGVSLRQQEFVTPRTRNVLPHPCQFN